MLDTRITVRPLDIFDIFQFVGGFTLFKKKKLLRLILKVTEITTEYQRWSKIGF